METYSPNVKLELSRSSIIEQLKAGKFQLHAFPTPMEKAFWQYAFENHLDVLRENLLIVALIFVITAFPTALAVFYYTPSSSLIHEATLWLSALIVGIITLSTIVLGVNNTQNRHRTTQIAAISLFVLHFWLTSVTLMYTSQTCVYVVTVVLLMAHVLSYFLICVPPIQLFLLLLSGITGAGILSIFNGNISHASPLLFILVYSATIVYLISLLLTARGRYVFLQSNLLLIEKQQITVLKDEMTRLSQIDSVTELYNRRTFNNRLHHEILVAKHRNHPLSLLFIDIDYFKLYNDTYGHLAGDKALQKVAQVIRKNTMDNTQYVAARYGGEEFVILLINKDQYAALHFAKQLETTLSWLAIPHKDSVVNNHLTLSIGISTEYIFNTKTADRLIKNADTAVYHAKASGRNQIFCYEATKDEKLKKDIV